MKNASIVGLGLAGFAGLVFVLFSELGAEAQTQVVWLPRDAKVESEAVAVAK